MYVTKSFSILLHFVVMWSMCDGLKLDDYMEYNERQQVCFTPEYTQQFLPINQHLCQMDLPVATSVEPYEIPKCEDRHINFEDNEYDNSSKFKLIVCNWQIPGENEFYALGSGANQDDAYIFKCNDEACNPITNWPGALSYSGTLTFEIFEQYNYYYEPICEGKKPLYPNACRQQIDGLTRNTEDIETQCKTKYIKFAAGSTEITDYTPNLIFCGWNEDGYSYGLGRGEIEGDAYLFKCDDMQELNGVGVCEPVKNLKGVLYYGSLNESLYRKYARRQSVCNKTKPMAKFICEQQIGGLMFVRKPQDPQCVNAYIKFDGSFLRDFYIWNVLFCGWYNGITGNEYAIGSGENIGDGYLFECYKEIGVNKKICEPIQNLLSALKPHMKLYDSLTPKLQICDEATPLFPEACSAVISNLKRSENWKKKISCQTRLMAFKNGNKRKNVMLCGWEDIENQEDEYEYGIINGEDTCDAFLLRCDSQLICTVVQNIENFFRRKVKHNEYRRIEDKTCIFV